MDYYSDLTEKEAVSLFQQAIKFRNIEIPLSGHIIGHIVGMALWHHGRFEHPTQAIGHITRLKVNGDGTLGVYVQYADGSEDPCHPGNLVYF